MKYPSQASFERLEGDPDLAGRDPGLLSEFEAAPWLLPPRTAALPYAGVHDLDELLELRSQRFGNWSKTITLLTFNVRFAIMTQNTIYSMVKFGGVRNYIVGTWNQTDLEACADLNLPCADITAFLPEPMDNGPDAGYFGTHDYLVVCWIRPVVLAHLLQQGYAVYNTDSDVAFVMKPVWSSYMKFIEDGKADAAFQSEWPVNGGNYVMLPTPASIRFAAVWAGAAVEAIKAGQHDQDWMVGTNGGAYNHCTNQEGCFDLRTKIMEQQLTAERPLFRSFPPSAYMYWSDPCALAHGAGMPLVDVCDWSVMFFHPICTDYSGKLAVFTHLGVWYVDKNNCRPRKGQISQVQACHPLRWRVPSAEAMLYACPTYGLALTHSRSLPSPAAVPQQQPPALAASASLL